MTRPNEPLIETRPAPIEADIYRVEPPRLLTSGDGTVIEVHAAYSEPETGDEIAVGRVFVLPAVHAIRTVSRATSRVEGRIGYGTIYDKTVPSLVFQSNSNIDYLPTPDMETILLRYKREAAHSVLAHLGIAADDLLPPPDSLGKRFLSLFKKSTK